MTTTEPPGCSTSALPSLAAVLGAHSALRTSRVRDHKLARLLAHGAQENTAFRRTGTARYSFGQISMCMYNVSSDRMQGLIRDRAWTKVGRVSLHPHPPPHPTPRRTLLLEPMSRGIGRTRAPCLWIHQSIPVRGLRMHVNSCAAVVRGRCVPRGVALQPQAVVFRDPVERFLSASVFSVGALGPLQRPPVCMSPRCAGAACLLAHPVGWQQSTVAAHAHMRRSPTSTSRSTQ